jgi:hypothetical protein
VLTWPAALGVWAVGRCLTSMRLRGGGCRQSYAAKRCSLLLEGPPATRGSTFPLRAASNHSIRQRSARHNPTPGVAGRPRSSSPGVFKNLPSSNEHEWAPDLVRRIRNGSRPATVGISVAGRCMANQLEACALARPRLRVIDGLVSRRLVEGLGAPFAKPIYE